MSNKNRVGVIGAGVMGGYHLRNYAELKEVDLMAVADTNYGRAHVIAEELGIEAVKDYKEMLGMVDMVSVASSSTSHAEIGEFFLKNGVSCLIEKPLAMTEGECLRLINAAKKSGAKLMVGHIERFNPAILKLTELLKKDKGIYAFEARRLSKASNRIADTDVVEDLMVHDIEVVLSLVPSKVKKVSAQNVKTLDSQGGDFVLAQIVFENGTLASFVASRISNSKIRTLEVSTTSAFYKADYAEQSLQKFMQGRNPALNTDDDYAVDVSIERLMLRSANQLANEQEHFVDCVLNNKKPLVTGEDALASLQVVWEIKKLIA